MGMSFGLQISASGVTTALYRQDVYANNLANMDTPGFKPDLPSTRFVPAGARGSDEFNLPPARLLERLGSGAALHANRVSMTQGSLQDSANPLDLGISGEGFFVVRDAQEREGQTLLTRDGRLTRDSSGRLVLASSGLPILDTGNGEIFLRDSAPVKVDADGSIRQRGQVVARVRLARVADPALLSKQGHSMFLAPTESVDDGAAGHVKQGAFEESAADEVSTIMQITSASRDVDANIAMMQQHDRLLDRAINVFGRLS
ncbi:MAG: flagellar hook basal-body protein [Leptolyngbya sp. PLA1]|nr:flagellar hook basal-body protein [Leptolyngbya sp. PLA1]